MLFRSRHPPSSIMWRAPPCTGILLLPRWVVVARTEGGNRLSCRGRRSGGLRGRAGTAGGSHCRVSEEFCTVSRRARPRRIYSAGRGQKCSPRSWPSSATNTPARNNHAQQQIKRLRGHVQHWGMAECWMQLYDRWSGVDDIGPGTAASGSASETRE